MVESGSGNIQDEPASADDEIGGLGKTVFVKWRLGAESPPALFANHVIATYDAPNFVVRFAQLLAPAARNEEEWARYQDAELEAPVVATLVIPAQRFANAIDNIADLLARLRSRGAIPPRSQEDEAP
jgi:hypothetical protein